MRHTTRVFSLLLLGVGLALSAETKPGGLSLVREKNWLDIAGPQLPGGLIRINYLEAYCRAGSSDADWMQHTVVPHRSEVLSLSGDHRVLRLRDTLADGLIVEHTITAREDEVDFQLAARNPTSHRSEAYWAQPCVRLGDFTGFGAVQTADDSAYLPKSFIFLEGKLGRLPTNPWAVKARYIPGQVWRPSGIPAADLNPRPMSALTPSNGLIGCFSTDEKWIFATAWEPYQELFQGVARCLHSDFRLGGVQPGATNLIRGKIYIVPGDVPALLRRYERDFPGQTQTTPSVK